MYETKRLTLRPYEDKDFNSFCQINQDPDVMRYFPSIFTNQDIINLTQRIKNNFEKYGFGFYTCELKPTKQFVGFVGLNFADFEAPFTPCFEIGWRIVRDFWGQGLALEAAQKCLAIGFNEFSLSEIVAFTAKSNHNSERVMQKLGMIHNEYDDFYHPKLAKDHPLSLHVLYRMNRDRWDMLNNVSCET